MIIAYDAALKRAAFHGASASILWDDDALLLGAGWPKEMMCAACGALAETLKGAIEWDADTWSEVWVCAACAKEEWTWNT